MKNKILFAILVVAALFVTVYAASAVDYEDPVLQQFHITSTPVTTAVVGEQYSYQVVIHFTGAEVPVHYNIVSGPSGMTVNSSGRVTWTPTQSGTYAVNLSVASTLGIAYVEYQAYNIVVNAPAPTQMLEIDRIKVKVGGSSDTLTSEGTIDEEAELGDDIEITVRVRNNLPDSNDNTFENIDLTTSSDLEEADDLEESVSDLDPGDDDEMTVSFTLDPDTVIPSDAPFDITIDVEGETEGGVTYTDSWTITLDMDVKSRELYILGATAAPTTFKNCADTKIRINVDLRNIGTKDLETAKLVFEIDSLGLEGAVEDIELDEGDDDSYTGYITVPEGATAGVYELAVRAQPSETSSTVTDTEVFDVTVQECREVYEPEEPEEEEEENETVIIPDVVVPGIQVSSSQGRSGLFDSDNGVYMLLLGMLIVVFIVVIILLVSKIRKE